MNETLYDSPELYEALFNPGLKDLVFYREWAASCHGGVLELGCGTGRLLWPLRQAGLPVEGLDASEAMLEACATRGQVLGLEALLHHGNWLGFDLKRRFGGIYLPFNGLQHLQTAADLTRFFERLRLHLLPAGVFALDLHLPQVAILARDPDERYGIEESPELPGGERVIAEQSRYDAAKQVLEQTWTLGAPDGTSRTLGLALRQFFPQELKMLLEQEGFVILMHSGGFKGEAMGFTSLKQVLVCRLKG